LTNHLQVKTASVLEASLEYTSYSSIKKCREFIHAEGYFLIEKKIVLSFFSLSYTTLKLEKLTLAVRKTGDSRHNGESIKGLLQSLNMIVLRCTGGFRGTSIGPPMMLRDATVSDADYDRCCFSSTNNKTFKLAIATFTN